MVHDCIHPQIVIGEAEAGDLLKVGDHVLAPCPECGETPLDTLETEQGRNAELQAALLAQEPYRWLYHWSPAVRRRQIIRFGLRPGMRGTTSVQPGYCAPCVCLADSPSWAWALSGDMRWTPDGEWDLWQTSIDRLIDPIVMATPDRPSGLYEVRTEHRIYKRDLWYVGSRVK